MTDAAAVVGEFIASDIDRALLGIVYGRRRIGKSTMLVGHVDRHHGFYFEATRAESRVQLDRLGRELGEHLGVGVLALADWEAAFKALARLGDGSDVPVPVVLDEFGHIKEADSGVDSVLASVLGPGARREGSKNRARLILCGSAISMMRALTAAEAPLRGRAGMELIMQPDDYRIAATRLPGTAALDTAVRTFCVIGGVVGYATDMGNFDLPGSSADFDRWVVDRTLSVGATLHREAATLLAEDPTVAGAGSLLHHSVLAVIANGSVTSGTIARGVGKQVSNIAPVLNRLIDAGFVVRHEDPLRAQRALYALTDPFLQFHYAVLEPFRSMLRDRVPSEVWDVRLRHVFDSRVRGPVFEEMARTWVRRFASRSTITSFGHVGPSHASMGGVDHELDVVVAEPGEIPGQRAVIAIGEAKAGEQLGTVHLRRLESARRALGPRATDAKLLLFGSHVDEALIDVAGSRPDVEIVNLERLYHGS